MVCPMPTPMKETRRRRRTNTTRPAANKTRSCFSSFRSMSPIGTYRFAKQLATLSGTFVWRKWREVDRGKSCPCEGRRRSQTVADVVAAVFLVSGVGSVLLVFGSCSSVSKQTPCFVFKCEYLLFFLFRVLCLVTAVPRKLFPAERFLAPRKRPKENKQNVKRMHNATGAGH